jgi:phage terminase large subunit-like protein
MNNILAYYQAIKDGSAPVGKWVRLWYDQLVEGLEAGRYFYDAKKATRAIRFVESFCHHHEGPKAPGLVRLELWQKAFLSVVFGIVDAEGLRQFRECVLVMGRKNGKTLLAASVAEYMAFLDGEYGGRIYFAAAKQKQAALCYDAFFQMIQQ